MEALVSAMVTGQGGKVVNTYLYLVGSVPRPGRTKLPCPCPCPCLEIAEAKSQPIVSSAGTWNRSICDERTR